MKAHDRRDIDRDSQRNFVFPTANSTRVGGRSDSHAETGQEAVEFVKKIVTTSGCWLEELWAHKHHLEIRWWKNHENMTPLEFTKEHSSNNETALLRTDGGMVSGIPRCLSERLGVLRFRVYSHQPRTCNPMPPSSGTITLLSQLRILPQPI